MYKIVDVSLIPRLTSHGPGPKISTRDAFFMTPFICATTQAISSWLGCLAAKKIQLRTLSLVS